MVFLKIKAIATELLNGPISIKLMQLIEDFGPFIIISMGFWMSLRNIGGSLQQLLKTIHISSPIR